MKILVIGSKGFIGKHLMQYFQALDMQVFGADIVFDYESKDYFRITESSSDFLTIFQEIKNFDWCINASGAANVSLSIDNPHNDFLLNTINVHHILESLRTQSPSTKFINLSSAAVYGNPIKLPIDENAASMPISPYGFHKLIAEQLCQEYAQIFDLQTCSARIFSAYGEGLMKQLFWDLKNKSIDNNEIELQGSGLETRDFIYVSDICNAVHLICLKGQFHGDAYNIASGYESTIKNAAKTFFECLNWAGSFEFIGQVRSGDPVNWKADISKIQILGFQPQVSLKDGLTKYCQWLKERK